MCYLQYSFFRSGGGVDEVRSVGEVAINQTNYQRCQFAVHCI